MVDPRFLSQLRDSVVGVNSAHAEDSHERREEATENHREAEAERTETLDKCAGNALKEQAV